MDKKARESPKAERKSGKEGGKEGREGERKRAKDEAKEEGRERGRKNARLSCLMIFHDFRPASSYVITVYGVLQFSHTFPSY